MYNAIMSTLEIVGWLGIILLMLVLINTVCGVVFNTAKEGQEFSFKVLFKGLFKAFIFYGCAALLSIAFTMLPFVNEMITNVYGVQLIANDTLNTLSTVAVLSVVVYAIVVQGKKALEGITQLLTVKVNNEEVITWEVKDPEEEVDE